MAHGVEQAAAEARTHAAAGELRRGRGPRATGRPHAARSPRRRSHPGALGQPPPPASWTPLPERRHRSSCSTASTPNCRSTRSAPTTATRCAVSWRDLTARGTAGSSWWRATPGFRPCESASTGSSTACATPACREEEQRDPDGHGLRRAADRRRHAALADRDLTVVIGCSTPLATASLQAIAAAGRSTPHDVAFATFDGYNHPDVFQPRHHHRAPARLRHGHGGRATAHRAHRVARGEPAHRATPPDHRAPRLHRALPERLGEPSPA